MLFTTFAKIFTNFSTSQAGVKKADCKTYFPYLVNSAKIRLPFSYAVVFVIENIQKVQLSIDT